MQKRIIPGLVVLVIIVGVVVWFSTRKKTETVAPLLSIAAFNQTKNTSAADIQANPGDTIVYTLTAQNQSDKVISGYIVQANISGITDKAALLDASGASYDSAINSLVWTPLDIPANQSITKIFSVKINPLQQGQGSTVLKITFNNELNISVAAGQVAGVVTPKPTGSVSGNLPLKAPTTGASDALPEILALLTTLGAVGISKYRQIKTSLWG